MNKDKEEMVIDLNNSYGFMLSYGDTSDIIPMGVYKVDSILPFYKNSYKYAGVSYRYDEVKLIKVNNDVEVTEDNAIYVPILEFKKLLNLEIEENNYFARQLSASDISDTELIYITKIAQKYYINHKLSPIEFYQRASLIDLNATYEANSNVVGTNYTLIPFSYGKVKKKVKTLR